MDCAISMATMAIDCRYNRNFHTSGDVMKSGTNFFKTSGKKDNAKPRCF